MADPQESTEGLSSGDDPRTPKSADAAAFWHAQIKLAGREEDAWRIRAGKLVGRYRDEREELVKSDSRLNIFAANVELLKPLVFSQTPAPAVRRRNLIESPLLHQIGRDVAQVLQRSLAFQIDDRPFDKPMEAVRDDVLIVGRGVAREVYEFETERRDDVQTVMQPPLLQIGPAGEVFETPRPPVYLLDGAPVQPQFGPDGAPFIERKTDERVVTRYWFWDDFRLSPARCWDDVWWSAFRHKMTRTALREEFGELGRRVPLTLKAKHAAAGDTTDGQPEDPDSRNRAEVWEIWHKTKLQRVWIATGHDTVLRRDEDPLRLKGFWPCPEPLYALTTTDSMVPLPEFCLYQDQADELDRLQARICHLIEVCKAVSVANGDLAEVAKITAAKDGDVIPIQSPGLTAEDFAGGVWSWPLERIVQAISMLSQRAEVVKRQIHEVTGLSDLQRGSAEPRVTAAAERTKSAYGQVRMGPRAAPMQRFVRDCLRIKAEIMAEMFEPETLQRMAGMAVSPPMVQLLREERLRNTTVDVATDSTIRPDAAAEREEAIEFARAITEFLTIGGPMAQQMPQLAPLVSTLLKVTARPFRLGREFEQVLEETAEAMAQPPAPPAGPNLPPGVQSMIPGAGMMAA